MQRLAELQCSPSRPFNPEYENEAPLRGTFRANRAATRAELPAPSGKRRGDRARPWGFAAESRSFSSNRHAAAFVRRRGGPYCVADPASLPLAGPMVYLPEEQRYQRMPYQRCGKSGLKLPRLSLGLWQNFGEKSPHENAREMLLKSFDRGITHFDLANNYGPPPGSAEETFGRILDSDLRRYRDELVISTKAGYWMWNGPYGEMGSRKYLLASLDQSLRRLKLDYVDIFYSHRFDPETPLEETLGALDTAVRSGKALYAGISSYGPEKTREAAAILRQLGTPCLIHQPSYSMLNRWVEDGLLDVLTEEGIGCIAFSPLAQGLLTDKYLKGVPENSRAAQQVSFRPAMLTQENLAKVRALDAIAGRRGQSLAQMAIAWVLRQPAITTALIGASSWAQIEQSLGALDNLAFSTEELAEIDRYATDGQLNIWARSSHGSA